MVCRCSYIRASPHCFFNPNRFQLIASQDKTFGEEELKKIKEEFETAEDINKWVIPVYAFTKDDTREVAQLPQDESNSVIGLKLAYEADSPENASAYVSFFGNYIRDCLLYETLYNYIIVGYSNTLTALKKNENGIMGLQFELFQNTNKMKDIRAILSNYPESAKIESRQLVSVQDGGSRFLAPVTQLVGIESTLADIRRDLAELKRERDKLTVRSEYFTRCFSEFARIGEHGESLFLMLKSIKDEVFKNYDLNKDEVKGIFNNLSIDLQTFDFTFFKNSRFISEPTIPALHIKPRKRPIVIVTLFASFFFFIFLSIVIEWWKDKKEIIISTTPKSV